MIVRTLLALGPAALERRLARLLDPLGAVVSVERRPAALLGHLRGEDLDLLVATPGMLSARLLERIRAIRELPDPPEVVMIVERDDANRRAELLAAGCLAVLSAEVADEVLAETLRVLLQRSRDEAMRRLRADRPEERYGLDDFVLASPVTRRFVARARKVVDTDSSLLLLGETGVGKERLARAIHAESRRSGGPFMTVNCGALTETLLESELFGHERGAFTDAVRARRGYFELAHGGTIFLDEVGEIPLHLQVKLLRVLEDRRIMRVGGERPVHVDVRVMAATNRDLEAEMRSGRFRPDLYYRLAVVTLILPPLRERREDIPILAGSYLEHFRTRLGRPVEGISPVAMEALQRYGWPGNLRELINVIEQAVLLSGTPWIDLEDLPHRMGGTPSTDGPPAGVAVAAGEWHDKPLHDARQEAVRSFERAYLSGLLQATRGRVGEAARRAAVNPRFLYELMRRHGLRKESFRDS